MSKNCDHKWKTVGHPEMEGWFQDRCAKCNADGWLDPITGRIEPAPIAKVIDLAQFRQTREIREKVSND